jgi:hypothetical protein
LIVQNSRRYDRRDIVFLYDIIFYNVDCIDRIETSTVSAGSIHMLSGTVGIAKFVFNMALVAIYLSCIIFYLVSDCNGYSKFYYYVITRYIFIVIMNLENV